LKNSHSCSSFFNLHLCSRGYAIAPEGQRTGDELLFSCCIILHKE